MRRERRSECVRTAPATINRLLDRLLAVRTLIAHPQSLIAGEPNAPVDAPGRRPDDHDLTRGWCSSTGASRLPRAELDAACIGTQQSQWLLDVTRRRYRPVMHDEPENADYVTEVSGLLEHAARDELTVYSSVLELALPGFTPSQGRSSSPLAQCMSTR